MLYVHPWKVHLPFLIVVSKNSHTVYDYCTSTSLLSHHCAHESGIFKPMCPKKKKKNFSMQCCLILVPKHWTNQKTSEPGQVLQAFVYRSKFRGSCFTLMSTWRRWHSKSSVISFLSFLFFSPHVKNSNYLFCFLAIFCYFLLLHHISKTCL